MKPVSFFSRVACVLFISIGATASYAVEYLDYLHWDWSSINTADIAFPSNFLFGVGTSALQVEGGSTGTTYTDAQYQARVLNERKKECAYCCQNEECASSNCSYQRCKKIIEGYEPLGLACDHWHQYKEDIALMQSLGIRAYRFSVDWSKIEPRPGNYNHEALHHYADVCATLIAHGIKPIIGLHHYADPSWFMRMGGFEKEKNVSYFVSFCEQVFNTLQSRCVQELSQLSVQQRATLMPLWLTFNSPASYAASGYLQGVRPPYVCNMQRMMETLQHLLQAHVMVYQALKDSASKSGFQDDVRIGITHNIYQLDPWDWYNPVHRLKCRIGNDLVHDSIYRFFTTGVFSIWVPTKVTVKYENDYAPQSLDFIALNYYGHAYLGATGSAFSSPQSSDKADDPRYNEIPTQMSRYTIYGEGLYRALHEINNAIALPLGIPIYVTENGVSAGTDDGMRDLFLRRYLFALSEAIREGCDVRGYMHWSLMDNYEWGTYDHQFGLCSLDRTTRQRSVKKGARYFVEVAQRQAALSAIA